MADARGQSPEAKPTASGIAKEIASFILSIDGLHLSFRPHLAFADAICIHCQRAITDFLEKYGQKQEESDGPIWQLPSEHHWELYRLSLRRQKADSNRAVFPQTGIVALVSQYDSFVGSLLRCLYRSRPEILQQSKKRVTYSRLAQFSSLDHAKDHILEKEIEATLRSSHADQFATMERRFDIKLRPEAWPKFIELTERRNLFVHCKGRVSEQYLIVCKKHKVDFPKKPQTGETLDVPIAYVDDAYDCLFEVGVTLGHTLWRKILPHEREVADSALLMQIYHVIAAKRYKLAIAMGKFAQTAPITKQSTDAIRKTNALNLAQAYKWIGQEQEALRICEGDWSSSSNELKLGVAVLKDDFDKAAQIMKNIGDEGIPSKADYNSWPIFQAFRKTRQFQDAYKEIFGDQFVPLQATSVDALLDPSG
jgi:hypothetical protein